MSTEQKPIQIIIDNIISQVMDSLIEDYKKGIYKQHLLKLDPELIEQGALTSSHRITRIDIKYMICFLIDMEIKDISLLFNIEPASARTVRYRVRKKFDDTNSFKYLL